MYAIVDIRGQQFKVEKNQQIFVHRLQVKEGSKIALRRAGRSHVSRRGVFHADELCQAKSG